MGREKRENYPFKFSFIFFHISFLDSFLFIVFSTLSFLVFSLLPRCLREPQAPVGRVIFIIFFNSPLFSLPVFSLLFSLFQSSLFLSSLSPFSLFQSSLFPFSLFSLPLVHNRSPLRLRKVNNSHDYRHSSQSNWVK